MPAEMTGFWAPVALSGDLPPATVIPARTTAGSIALWRSQSGRVAASADRCPHRGMRLSHGFVRGEALSCIYHGWSYSQAGNCLRIPAHPGLSPPETIRVATQKVEEADGLLWVAVGDPAHQPPALAGLVPLRSLTVEADIGAIERAAGATLDARGVLETVENSQAVRLLLVELQPHRTLVHVLVDDGATPAERIMASRAAESLRRRAESLQGGIA
ncbi:MULTISPECIES: Rieske 2Fe-2S domain-containing protein [unclassified Rhizobium]|uniref:Rieske 2Fe-2S domain-containing protein n=1 Tax=unclassified Rhizobium TaxID=2613769 RepID=UPI001622663E|nr:MULTISPECIES: Rieske 2Fe-2S domain-containing protein [unclassified Rhizobium]MBB3318008.1 nitrite reductase/ring-hydroxylating ferredoxin subunit [Rhizobium sp. BK181]MBB3544264.1 nitrite reductase/ring-hydroxylating ferredoxin subunit [Rhizobium sp. BK399]MCS3742896.1 nitrite reductase/ring-hydroxylating ferredoxin subunit [Rhizobium sp. BK661]MCS4095090.1 nitrite reductase/ring-hydroxylating ferredoxin subunit [Rhizobium sp. BK176]